MSNINMVKGKIHSYHTLTAIDGPGLRFLLFLQGCPLRCMYCHNPDSWKQEDFQEERTAEEILEMFAGVWSNENPLYRTPVHLILRPIKGETEKWRGYLVCGNEEVPVEVIDFSTAEKPDWSYEKRKRKFFAMGEKIS